MHNFNVRYELQPPINPEPHWKEDLLYSLMEELEAVSTGELELSPAEMADLNEVLTDLVMLMQLDESPRELWH